MADFSVWALLAACIANVFAAFRSNENKKLMDTEGLSVRLTPTPTPIPIPNPNPASRCAAPLMCIDSQHRTSHTPRIAAHPPPRPRGSRKPRLTPPTPHAPRPPRHLHTLLVVQDRIGSVGNQFALTTLLGALCVLPVFLLTEGSKLGESMAL